MYEIMLITLGLFVGANVGIITLGILQSAKDVDHPRANQS